jgi:hypothetical protein
MEKVVFARWSVYVLGVIVGIVDVVGVGEWWFAVEYYVSSFLTACWVATSRTTRFDLTRQRADLG